MLGGSHALNAMIWVRCAPPDYDHWAEVGGDGWSWNDVLPVYQAIEDFSGGESDLRGVGGPLPVTDDYALSPIQASIIEAAVEEGLEHNPDYNGDHLDGISQEQVTMKDGRRSNTWTAYLKPVRDQLDIRTGCHVHSVIVEDGRAVGVRYRQDGVDHELRADEVVLAAGALDSPAILLRSGIGPAGDLEQLGIPVVLDSPEVGRNLHDHLLSPVIFTTTAKPVGPPAERGLGDADPPVLEEPPGPRGARHAADQLLGADVRRDPRADRERRVLAHGGDRHAEEPRHRSR